MLRALLTDDGRHLATGSALPDLSECEIQAWDVHAGRRVGEEFKGKGEITLFVEPGSRGMIFGGMSGDPDDFIHG